ncbi:MAG TPA: YkvA family protein, partial [Salinimicrobium sp.]|nr:YkvA family protein [Salinimicrobium sp.]
MKDNINPREAEQALSRQSEKIQEDDLDEVLKKQEKIEEKFRNHDSIKGYLEKAGTMFSLIRDYAKGNYREVPWKIIAAAAGGLLYVFMPLDIIPDFIPVAGFLDDAGVLAACLKLVNGDLIDYKKWQVMQESE